MHFAAVTSALPACRGGGLVPGETLVLAAGEYPLLTIANLAGAPGRCITITGPAGDRPAVIFGQIGNGTVEIIDSSYVVLSNIVFEPARAIERSR